MKFNIIFLIFNMVILNSALASGNLDIMKNSEINDKSVSSYFTPLNLKTNFEEFESKTESNVLKQLGPIYIEGFNINQRIKFFPGNIFLNTTNLYLTVCNIIENHPENIIEDWNNFSDGLISRLRLLHVLNNNSNNLINNINNSVIHLNHDLLQGNPVTICIVKAIGPLHHNGIF